MCVTLADFHTDGSMPPLTEELKMVQTGLEMRQVRSRKIHLGIPSGLGAFEVLVAMGLMSTISLEIMNWSGALLVVGAASGHRGSKTELTDWKKLLISPASTYMSPPQTLLAKLCRYWVPELLTSRMAFVFFRQFLGFYILRASTWFA